MIQKLKIALLTIVVASITFGFTTYKNDFFEIAKQIEIFTNLYKEVNMNYVDEVSPSELMDTAIEAMLKDLDPYTVYWNEQEIQNARIQNSGNYTGIGADIQTEAEDILIINIIKDSPADKAGLKIGDKITKIGNISVENYNEDAGELLKGAPNSEVQLEFFRNGNKQQTTLKRGVVKIKAVPYYELLENKTAYIVLSQFTRSASAEVIDAFQELKEKGAERVILDLRNNPGGLLSEAVNVSNIFIEKGTTITYTKSVIEKYNKTYPTRNKAIDTEIPVAVLINEKSASASEIVSGSIQDLDRGVVIGSRSFGKGLVQRPKKLNYGTQAKITISRYYTPSGRCIQALDYKDGESVRKDESEYTEFKTRSGRSVYDGGGVKPDIEIEVEKESDVVKALQQKDMIFDFANKFYYENKDLKIDDFTFESNLIKDFQKFLKKENFIYETETDKALDVLKNKAKTENNTWQNISKSVADLEKELQKEKEKAIENETETIQKMLTEAIIRRYGYDDRVYQYYTEKGQNIQTAIKILTDKDQYNSILKI
ncbi:S41 family peptidase [Psychroflexus aestuariivivens]|uniref:S41 family peptidase n=1 Tax=Psychroflexus aestuariivivens TaxID=1795040 RepID=UPI000FD7E015|nr:S41 family peptidase [Psychroflexus aestuariivivens]